MRHVAPEHNRPEDGRPEHAPVEALARNLSRDWERRRPLLQAAVRAVLAGNGGEPSELAVGVISCWLERQLTPANAARRCERLGDAVRTGEQVISVFSEEFARFFGDPGTPGAEGRRHIARGLWIFRGYTRPAQVDAVLEHIHGRFEHFLRHAGGRFQPSLFGPLTLDRRRLKGYFIKVALLECRKVAVVGPPPTAAPAASPTTPAPRLQGGRGTSKALRWLDRFWSRDNGFSPAHRMEGLVSILMGSLTGIPELEVRTAEFLQKRAEALREEEEKLGARISRLMDRRDELSFQIALHAGGSRLVQLKRQLEWTEVQLTLCHHRAATLYRDGLLPRPAEVQALLDGYVTNTANTRFGRLRQELAILEKRARTRPSAPPFPPDILQLAAQVEDHASRRPPPPGQHGIGEPERQRRREALLAWKDQAGALLEKAIQLGARRAAEGGLPAGPGQRVLEWLTDLEAYLRLGVLQADGVLGALNQFRGWRLAHVLRSASGR
jgi:hypothetical protein